MLGFLIVEPASHPARYDQAVLLAAHHLEGPLGRHAGDASASFNNRGAARMKFAVVLRSGIYAIDEINLLSHCGMGRKCKMVRVWDAPTRLFHWAAMGLVAVLYLSWRYDRMDWHALAGEVLLALLLFRLLWGFFGSDTARFACFVESPREAMRHLAHLLRREPNVQVGHNPAGGWMVLAMLALLLGETLTGLYVNNDVANDGPLTAIVSAQTSNFITDLHKILWTALLTAIALHVLAILVYAVVKRHDLVRPMLTGRKLLPEEVSAPRIASPSLGAFLLAFAAGAAALIAALL